MQSVYEIAVALVRAGISVVPIKPDGSKAPAVTWQEYQRRLPNDNELAMWFKGRVRGLAAIGGSVSGGLECIDFDEPGLFDEYAAALDRTHPDLLSRCVIVKTPSVGAHVWYRAPQVAGNQKLAMRPPTDQERVEFPDARSYTRIETRGAGGYAIIPGSPPSCHPFGMPYEYTDAGRASLLDVQMITQSERDVLLALAMSFNTFAEAPRSQTPPPAPRKGEGLSPGDDYERRSSWQDVLEPKGWHLESGTWDRGRLTRPGKDHGCSATVGICRGKSNEPLLFVFSSSAGIDCGSYGKFRAYSHLYHRGDYKAAAADLRSKGYGDQPPARNQPTSSANLQQPAETKTEAKPWTIKPTNVAMPTGGITAADLVKLEMPPPRYAVGNLLCEGLTILGGRPKQGKSWLSLLIAWAVASGQQLDGRDIDGGDVLFLALEDTNRRLQQRLKMLRPAAWDFPARLHIHTTWQRADQGGLYFLNEWFATAKNPRFAVIDTLAKFRRPCKGNGNNYAEDYEALSDIKGVVDQYGASALVVHHTRKLQAEDPFDELSGTLAISGAADGLMVLDRKRGENGGRLFVTGRDVPEMTIPLSLDRETFRWSLGAAQEGINTDGRSTVTTTDSRLDQCCAWLKSFLKDYAYPSDEIKEAAEANGFNFPLLKKAKARMGKHGTGEITSVNYGGSGKDQDWWSGLGDVSGWIKRPPVKEPRNPRTSGTSGTSEIPD